MQLKYKNIDEVLLWIKNTPDDDVQYIYVHRDVVDEIYVSQHQAEKGNKNLSSSITIEHVVADVYRLWRKAPKPTPDAPRVKKGSR